MADTLLRQKPLAPWAFHILFGGVAMLTAGGLSLMATGLNTPVFTQAFTWIAGGTLLGALLATSFYVRSVRIEVSPASVRVEGALGGGVSESQVTLPRTGMSATVRRGIKLRYEQTYELVLGSGGSSVVVRGLVDEPAALERVAEQLRGP